jgi:hypothetical protein
MNYADLWKISRILREGGTLLMHKNDFEKLDKDKFGALKIAEDLSGAIAEGQAVAINTGEEQ